MRKSFAVKSLAGDFAQVIVHVLGADVAVLAVFRIGEELLPRQFLAAADDPGEAHIVQLDFVMLAALAAKGEDDVAVPLGLNVAVAHRRQAVRMVLAGIFIVANTDDRRLQQPHDGGEDLGARHSGLAKVARDAAADFWQSLPEPEHVLEFRLVALLPPMGMVTVLLAPAGIPAGGLQMAILKGEIQTWRVGGRDGQFANSGDHRLVADAGAVRTEEDKVFPLQLAGEAFRVVGAVAQPGGLRFLNERINRSFAHGQNQALSAYWSPFPMNSWPMIIGLVWDVNGDFDEDPG